MHFGNRKEINTKCTCILNSLTITQRDNPGIYNLNILLKGYTVNKKNNHATVVKKCFTHLYHRERILETSTLSCNEEEEEITKPPTR